LKTIHYKASGIAKQSELAICLGFFDGLHIAHQTLMNKTIEEGKKRGLKTAMLTFSDHILSFLKKEPFSFITSLKDKISAARKLGFDFFYVLDVSEGLVRMEPSQFIDHFLKNQALVIVGFDFTFGNKGIGNATLLKQQTDFETIVIDEMDFEDEKIGTTRIRQCTKGGNMEEVAALMGKPYTIKGKVIPGKNRGKAMGFPTANIKNTGYLTPKQGVYISTVKIGKRRYKGIANVGKNPTFGDITESIEVYVMDFDGHLYGHTIELSFLHFIREEIKFNTVEDLIEKMKEDEMVSRNYFNERKII